MKNFNVEYLPAAEDYSWQERLPSFVVIFKRITRASNEKYY